MLRAVAAGLALLLVLAAAGTHDHVGPHGEEHCAVCVARHADVPPDAAVDLAPVPVEVGAAVADPGLAPVTGAPLGAIPGQSPPA